MQWINMDKDSNLRQKISTNCQLLASEVDVLSLLQSLLHDDVISSDDVRDIQVLPDNINRVNKLLLIADSKGPGVHMSLIQSLRENGYQNVADKVQNTPDTEGGSKREVQDERGHSDILPCGCPGPSPSGECVLSGVTNSPAPLPNPIEIKTIMAVGSNMVKKHEFKGKIKKYQYSKLEVFTFLQANREKVNLGVTRDDGGFSLLHHTVLENRVEMVSVLMDAGLLQALVPLMVTSDHSNYYNMTALEIAAKLRQVSMQDELQALKDSELALPVLHKMARIARKTQVKRIIEKHPELLDEEASDVTTPLYWAVVSGCKETVKILVEKKADVLCRSGKGDTLLTKAVSVGHQKLVDYLVNKCSLDPDMSGANGKTPIQIAIENDNTDMIKELLRVGAIAMDINFIHLAIAGNITNIQTILKRFTLDINYQDRKGKSALFYSAENGHKKIAQFFLSKGADPKICDRRQRSIFHAAVESGNSELLQFLLEYATDEGFIDLVNQPDKFIGGDRIFLVRGRDGGTLAFHYVEVDRFFMHRFREITRSGGSLDVAQFGNVVKSGWGAHPPPEVVKEIDAMYGCSVVTPDTPDDMTALGLAVLKEKPECALVLLNCEKVHANVADKFGLTVMHMACVRGMVEVVRRLEERGADLNQTDNLNRTPLQAAHLNGHMKVVNFIKGKEFRNTHMEGMQTFRTTMNAYIHNLEEDQLAKVRGEGQNIKQHTIRTMREMVGEINNLLYDMGTSPIAEESATN